MNTAAAIAVPLCEASFVKREAQDAGLGQGDASESGTHDASRDTLHEERAFTTN